MRPPALIERLMQRFRQVEGFAPYTFACAVYPPSIRRGDWDRAAITRSLRHTAGGTMAVVGVHGPIGRSPRQPPSLRAVERVARLEFRRFGFASPFQSSTPWVVKRVPTFVAAPTDHMLSLLGLHVGHEVGKEAAERFAKNRSDRLRQWPATASDIDVIASRSLELRHETGTSTPVLVHIGRPRWVSAAECRCDYAINGLSKKRTFHVSGVDEVQALWIALVGAGIDLRTSAEGKAGRIMFDGATDLFFPSAEQLTRPEWHPFTAEGEALHWRTYPSWQPGADEEADEAWNRSWSLEVARRPDARGVGTSFPSGTVVGEDQARALVRLLKEHGESIP